MSMKRFSKTYLSTALAAVLAGGSALSTVGAVTLSQDNIGDVGIGPYYTMLGGWSTDTFIMNTSGKTVAAKVRYHEARNSREVLDFIIVLSPYDMINFFAVDDAQLGPVVKFPAGNSEKTCVVPIPGGRVGGVGGTLPFSDSEYTGGNFDGGPTNIARLKEGYFTVIEMGASDARAAESVNQWAITKQCDKIEDAFRLENIVDTYNEFDRNLNALKVSFSLTNIARGTQGSASATMLANFATNRSAIAHTQTSILAGGDALGDAEAALGAATQARQQAYNAVQQTLLVLDSSSAGCTAADITDPSDPDYVPVDGAFPPNTGALNQGTCSGNADLNAEYVSNVAAHNQAKVEYDQALAARDEALAIFGAPRNLIHAQAQPAERYPNLNSGDFFGYWFRDGNYRVEAPEDLPPAFNLPFGLWFGLYPRPVDAITALLMKSDAMNEWAFNANTGASTALTFAAPTKRWYSDWRKTYANNPHWEGISPILANAIVNADAGWPPFSEQFSGGVQGQACDQVAVALYNNDELGPDDPVLPSPTAVPFFCNEVNVVYTGENVLNSEVALEIPVRDLFPAGTAVNETYNGWANVNMEVSASNYHPAIPLLNVTLPNIPAFWPLDEIVQTGMPYIGFNMKERDLGQAASYAGITPHSYLRGWDVRNLLGGTLTVEDLAFFGPANIIEGVISWFGTNPILPIDNRGCDGDQQTPDCLIE
jgi:hypothetical protein